jgi:uncharacterized membrane protein YgdD (TMEM256/DUF423 family)
LIVKPDRLYFVIGSVFAGTAVAAGAFGAHGLRGSLEPRLLEAFATGARYLMFHALALLAVSWAVDRWPTAGLELGGRLIATGTVVFSGSLFVMALTGLRWLGAVTPIGGVLMIGGWAVLAVRVARRR